MEKMKPNVEGQVLKHFEITKRLGKGVGTLL